MKKLRIIALAALAGLSFSVEAKEISNISAQRKSITTSVGKIWKKLKTPKGLFIAVPALFVSNQLFTNKPSNKFNYKKLGFEHPEQVWYFINEVLIGCLKKDASLKPKFNEDPSKCKMVLSKGQKAQGVLGKTASFAIGSMKLPLKLVTTIAGIAVGLEILNDSLLSDLEISS